MRWSYINRHWWWYLDSRPSVESWPREWQWKWGQRGITWPGKPPCITWTGWCQRLHKYFSELYSSFLISLRSPSFTRTVLPPQCFRTRFRVRYREGWMRTSALTIWFLRSTHSSKLGLHTRLCHDSSLRFSMVMNVAVLMCLVLVEQICYAAAEQVLPTHPQHTAVSM